MKRSAIFALAAIIIFFSSCEKFEDDTTVTPTHEPTLPEIIETELSDILSRDWKSLSDTLGYFNDNLLSKGKFKGTAPDGVYYELDVDPGLIFKTTVTFTVQDSIWAYCSGRALPLDISLCACDTDLGIKFTDDSTTISADNISARIPLKFVSEDGHTAPVIYNDNRVGYLTIEQFENPDYTTVKSLVLHYYSDTRTFSFYDTGLIDFLQNGKQYL